MYTDCQIKVVWCLGSWPQSWNQLLCQFDCVKECVLGITTGYCVQEDHDEQGWRMNAATPGGFKADKFICATPSGEAVKQIMEIQG